MSHEVVHISRFHFPSRFRSECIQAAMQTSLCSTFLGTKHFSHTKHIYSNIFMNPMTSRLHVVHYCRCCGQTQLVQLSSKKFCTLTLPVRSGSNKANVSFLVCDGCNMVRSGVLWLPHHLLGSWFDQCIANDTSNTIGTKMSRRSQKHDYLWLFDMSFKYMFFTTMQLHFFRISTRTPAKNKQKSWPNKTSTVDSRPGFRSASRPQRQQLWWTAGSIWETPTSFR